MAAAVPSAASCSVVATRRSKTACPQRFQQFAATFTVPQQTINSIVNPPQTDLSNTTYNVAGVDPANQHSGLITVDQLVAGKWFSPNATNEVLLGATYAQKNKLPVGSKITVNGTTYNVVGIVNPTLTGETADVYFPLATLQKLATKQDRVTQILVKAKSSNDVDKVAAAIQKQLPGAEVVTTKTLADQATGSLKDADDLGEQLRQCARTHRAGCRVRDRGAADAVVDRQAGA